MDIWEVYNADIFFGKPVLFYFCNKSGLYIPMLS